VQADELGDMINAAGTWARVRVQVGDLGSKEYAALRRQVVTVFQEGLGENVDWRITGSLDMSKEATQMFVRDMLVSFTTGFVLISLILMARFRSVRLGLLSMVPNVLPMLVTFAVMALLGIRLQIGTLVVFSIGLGIAVDDTIYFLSRCAKEVSEGASHTEAARRTLLSDGRAMLITSLVLTLGFAVVMISQFAALRFFGLLNGTVFLTGIVAELMLTPALVRVLRPF
jgi:predicted RND superfamily exporter protein